MKLYHAWVEVHTLVAAENEDAARELLEDGAVGVFQEELGNDILHGDAICIQEAADMPESWTGDGLVWGVGEDLTAEEALRAQKKHGSLDKLLAERARGEGEG